MTLLLILQLSVQFLDGFLTYFNQKCHFHVCKNEWVTGVCVLPHHKIKLKITKKKDYVAYNCKL